MQSPVEDGNITGKEIITKLLNSLLCSSPKREIVQIKLSRTTDTKRE